MNEGKTKYCLFPFTKPFLGANDIVKLCCAVHAGHVIMGNASENGFSSIWNGDGYVSLRRALLTGEGLPSYCLECERAPEVDPITMQMEVALRQVYLFPFDELKEFIRMIKSRYPDYVEEMKRIGVSAQRYENVAIDMPTNTVRMQNIYIERLKQQNIIRLERFKQQIYNSLSWKITFPLRLVGKLALKLKQSTGMH